MCPSLRRCPFPEYRSLGMTTFRGLRRPRTWKKEPTVPAPGSWVATIISVVDVARDARDLLAPADQIGTGSSTCGIRAR
jgi:hypothetical protein